MRLMGCVIQVGVGRAGAAAQYSSDTRCRLPGSRPTYLPPIQPITIASSSHLCHVAESIEEGFSLRPIFWTLKLHDTQGKHVSGSILFYTVQLLLLVHMQALECLNMLRRG